MWPFAKKIPFHCVQCGHVVKISPKRIRWLKAYYHVKEQQPLRLECHMCHMGFLEPINRSQTFNHNVP